MDFIHVQIDWLVHHNAERMDELELAFEMLPSVLIQF